MVAERGVLQKAQEETGWRKRRKRLASFVLFLFSTIKCCERLKVDIKNGKGSEKTPKGKKGKEKGFVLPSRTSNPVSITGFCNWIVVIFGNSQSIIAFDIKLFTRYLVIEVKSSSQGLCISFNELTE
ncbi:hypothetical protein RUM43_011832 [Polyplax serrata]|uniref:Uncharacterized protein n=1 Tax=Polyplax serrata TaxID=468196 RepID=A0AAN8NYU2_POLSC